MCIFCSLFHKQSFFLFCVWNSNSPGLTSVDLGVILDLTPIMNYDERVLPAAERSKNGEKNDQWCENGCLCDAIFLFGRLAFYRISLVTRFKENLGNLLRFV